MTPCTHALDGPSNTYTHGERAWGLWTTTKAHMEGHPPTILGTARVDIPALRQTRVANVEPGLDLDYLPLNLQGRYRHSRNVSTIAYLDTYLLDIHTIRTYIYDHAHPTALLGPWAFQCVAEPRARVHRPCRPVGQPSPGLLTDGETRFISLPEKQEARGINQGKTGKDEHIHICICFRLSVGDTAIYSNFLPYHIPVFPCQQVTDFCGGFFDPLHQLYKYL